MSIVSMLMIAVKTSMTCCQRCTEAEGGERKHEKVAWPRRIAVVRAPAMRLLSTPDGWSGFVSVPHRGLRWGAGESQPLSIED